jgi:hypothetical protein
VHLPTRVEPQHLVQQHRVRAPEFGGGAQPLPPLEGRLACLGVPATVVALVEPRPPAYGSYAFVVGYDSRLGLLAVDVSTPATPVPLSVIPGPGSSSVCSPAQDSTFKTRRAGVAVRGSRAWMNFRNGMREIELE